MSEFVEQLRQEGVFAKEVQTGGYAFHSHFMEAIAPSLLRALKKVGRLPSGAARSGLWSAGGEPEPRGADGHGVHR